MVTARFLRAAGACFTMCPFVVCGGEGDGRVLTRVGEMIPNMSLSKQGRPCRYFDSMCGDHGNDVVLVSGNHSAAAAVAAWTWMEEMCNEAVMDETQTNLRYNLP